MNISYQSLDLQYMNRIKMINMFEITQAI